MLMYNLFYIYYIIIFVIHCTHIMCDTHIIYEYNAEMIVILIIIIMMGVSDEQIVGKIRRRTKFAKIAGQLISSP